MEEVLCPRDAGRFIAKNSKDVSIAEEGVRSVASVLCEKYQEKTFGVECWKSMHELHPQMSNEDAINWVFVVDTLNFSFWAESDDTKCLVKYKEEMYSGYWTLCAAMNRALDEGFHMTSASYYSNITFEELSHVLRSDSGSPMPMLAERHRVLTETGRILVQSFGGSFLECLRRCGHSAQALLRLVVENFPCYRDEATFKSKRVALYKRAQILVADIWGLLEGKGDGFFNDIGTLTMFADYRVPQALVYLGALKYSSRLTQKLKDGVMFESGEEQEVEIRGCSIWCVELIQEELARLLAERGVAKAQDINAVLLDYYLWDYARAHRDEMAHIPIHHIRCIYY
ncbi:unnamed protein product [Lampetra planeri]